MNAIWLWTIKGLVIAALAAGLWYAHGLTAQVKSEVAGRQAVLERTPQDLLYASALQADLEKHAFDAGRIRTYITARDEIVDTVSRIEALGAKRKVEVSVPEIAEEVFLNAAGVPAEPPGPARDVRLRVIAQGEPADLLTFLYEVEHAPHLIYYKTLTLSLDRSSALRGSAGTVPQDKQDSARAGAFLQFDAIISVNK